MAKKSAALRWHFGLVTEPPSDRGGKEYLVLHLPKVYQLEGDTLVRYFAASSMDFALSFM